LIKNRSCLESPHLKILILFTTHFSSILFSLVNNQIKIKKKLYYFYEKKQKQIFNALSLENRIILNDDIDLFERLYNNSESYKLFI